MGCPKQGARFAHRRDLKLLREHRGPGSAVALDSGLPARLVPLPFLNFPRVERKAAQVNFSVLEVA